MKRYVIFCICILSFNMINAQIFYLYGNKTYGGNKKEIWGNIRKFNDYLLICGSSETDVNGDKTDSLCNFIGPPTRDLWLLQIDTSFNVIWQNVIKLPFL